MTKHNDRHLHAVQHKLDRVEITVNLATSAIDGSIGFQAVGRAMSKRSALWTYHESFGQDVDREKGYGIGDAASHVVLVCVQDRPNSLDRLDFALQGGLSYGDEEMFPGH